MAKKPYEMPVFKGWMCPLCGRIYSPFNGPYECRSCNDKRTDDERVARALEIIERTCQKMAVPEDAEPDDES